MSDQRGSSLGATRWRPSRRQRRDPPAWTRSLAEGDDAGFFGPGSAVWAVNGALPTLVAGIRALLLQTLHPGAMAGVHDHSRYNEDPLGRLDGTVRWVAMTTFGDRRSAAAASAHVSRLHERITGTYVDARGTERPYSANDEELLRWVHDAFTEAFIGAHELWGGPIPGGADAYVREWAQAGRLMGVQNPPTTVAELRAEMAGFLDDAKPDERVAQAVRFLRRPGLPGLTGAVYPILFGGAVASLEPHYRNLLGLERPWWPAVTLTRVLLTVAKRVLGPVSPSEQNARARLARLDSTAPSHPHR
ncbi:MULTISPECIES: oxygenase MpaB family protein [unclassified Diaminobutyricimonas]|uniref:oxygenase MpaB family protein n=1 Tax=unclassified Diaminobutyricimonas TaxID=2643261 RepID=UPI0012F4DD79|nr:MULTISPECIES: oxygenase MpaB family protein [unclassified Diaminobutyricimonas]